MKLRKSVVLLTSVLVLILVASVAMAGGGGEKAGEKKTIVLLMIGMESPYCPPYVSNFQVIVNAAGMNLFMFNAKFDAQLQSTQMDDAIAMRPALICVFAADSQGIAPGIKKAFDAGIPVLMINNPPVKESVPYTVAYAGPNIYAEGQVAGEMMNELLKGNGKVVMIEGLAGQAAQIDRANGFMDKLKELNSKIEVIGRQTASWRKDLAIQVMQDFITRFGSEIDAVYGQDDTLGVGAALAMQEAGMKPGAIPIIGIGGSREGLKAIADGIMYGTVMQSPIVETNLVAPMAVELVTCPRSPRPMWRSTSPAIGEIVSM
jgi:ribose transport system substrate-binding protein